MPQVHIADVGTVQSLPFNGYSECNDVSESFFGTVTPLGAAIFNAQSTLYDPSSCDNQTTAVHIAGTAQRHDVPLYDARPIKLSALTWTTL